MPTLYHPDILHVAGAGLPGAALLVGDDGAVVRTVAAEELGRVAAQARLVRLPQQALLPAIANVHSHAFQRLFRGRAEGRRAGGDTFWTWREQMYRAAAFADPEQMYAIARAVYLEMLQAGTALVGEFHYVHRDRDGQRYSDPNALAEAVIAAAQSLGMRITLLRSAYFRAGFGLEPHPGQRRFYEQPEEYLAHLDALASAHAGDALVQVGAAPHSIRAVPLAEFAPIAGWTRSHGRPMHLHISEQPAENAACLREYGATPVTLLDGAGLLDGATTLVHAIHITEEEMARVASAGATICSCPTTERNLGDGIFPADWAARHGVRIAFGSDSQAQIHPFEDARQLEYHLRLRDRERGVLDGSVREGWKQREPIGQALLAAMTGNGYRSLGVAGGALEAGQSADFFTLRLDDLALLGTGAADLAEQVVFSASPAAVDAVYVQGRPLLEQGRHPEADAIHAAYRAVQREFLQG